MTINENDIKQAIKCINEGLPSGSEDTLLMPSDNIPLKAMADSGLARVAHCEEVLENVKILCDIAISQAEVHDADKIVAEQSGAKVDAYTHYNISRHHFLTWDINRINKRINAIDILEMASDCIAAKRKYCSSTIRLVTTADNVEFAKTLYPIIKNTCDMLGSTLSWELQVVEFVDGLTCTIEIIDLNSISRIK